MKRLMPYLIIMFAAAGTVLSMQNQAAAKEKSPLYPGFPSLRESKAYQQFKTRPANDKSKLLYLIDRFAESDLQIVYDGHYFDAKGVGPLARWFLLHHYGKQNAKKWIMAWCNTSLGGTLIWVQLPDGKFRLSREVLFEDLEALNETMSQETTPLPSTSLPSESVASSGLGTASFTPMVQPGANSTTT